MTDDPQSLEPLLELSTRDLANGLHGRAVAARVPEDAGRAAARRARAGPRNRHERASRISPLAAEARVVRVARIRRVNLRPIL